MVFHVLIYVVEGVIGPDPEGTTLPLKLFTQRRIPAMLIGYDEVEGVEEGTETNDDGN